MENLITVHSFESLAALDGPGVRLGVFLTGCPLRCAYCHNPDTWDKNNGTKFTSRQLVEKIERYVPYFGNIGGVTFSGGEPLLWAKELNEIAQELEKQQIHMTIDTAGSILNDEVRQLLEKRPLVLLDVKMPDEQRYNEYIKGSLRQTLDFLETADRYGCEIWLRYVVLPSINDSEKDVRDICEIGGRFRNVKKVELLPYHTLGVDKYEKLGLDYSLKHLQPPTPEEMHHLEKSVKEYYPTQRHEDNR